MNGFSIRLSIDGHIEPIHASSSILPPGSAIINCGFITAIFFNIVAPYAFIYLVIFITVI